MAELAPLATAHAHARKAAEQTRHIRWPEAAEEHQNAAADFARAVRGTSDAEALRILKLLEDQHRKLATIISSKDQPELEDLSHGGDRVSEAQKTTSAGSDLPSTSGSIIRDKATITATTAAAARLNPNRARDASPSLARDIASRRGIPQTVKPHLSPAAQARARQPSPESNRRTKPTLNPKIPPSIMDSQLRGRPDSVQKKGTDDEGFSNFYNNLTTGTMSKLSSVLAFAGLPLTVDDLRRESESKAKSERSSSSSGNEPDVKQIFSKAALNAIEDDHRQRGLSGRAFGPAESFYMVQTGGGTYSYADIAKSQHQHLSGIGETDEEAFVDAREAQAPPSPRHSRSGSQSGRGSFGKPRTHEELELENTTLKHTLEQLASRLANFEAHAQDASMAALTQSMASLRSHPVTSEQTALERLRALEQQMEQQAEQKAKLEELARKQEKKIRLYHSKWEEIKKSAKEKERAKKERAQGQDVEEGEPGTNK